METQCTLGTRLKAKTDYIKKNARQETKIINNANHTMKPRMATDTGEY